MPLMARRNRFRFWANILRSGSRTYRIIKILSLNGHFFGGEIHQKRSLLLVGTFDGSLLFTGLAYSVLFGSRGGLFSEYKRCTCGSNISLPPIISNFSVVWNMAR